MSNLQVGSLIDCLFCLFHFQVNEITCPEAGECMQVAQLIDMGFDEHTARAALRQASGDPASALEKLLAG